MEAVSVAEELGSKHEATENEENPEFTELMTTQTTHTETSELIINQPHEEGISDLLDFLNSDHLTELRVHFYEKKVDEKIKEPKGSAHPRFRGFKLNKDEFMIAIETVLGNTVYNEAASALFDQLVSGNAEEHKGFLWWEQILDELIDFMAEKTKSRPGNIVKESFCSLHPMPHSRRETIVKVVPVETPTSFCYVVVSKYGKVGLYDWHLSLLEQFEVRLSTQIATAAGGEVRRTTWVTDALYMADAATVLVSASDRSLHLYAVTGLVCTPVYLVSGLPNTPTCLHYTPKTADGPSMLLVGDDQGSIATVHFHQPQYALLKRTSNDSYDKYYWKELSSQKAWVTISMDQGVHKDEVTRVEYFSDNNTVVSCSNDPNTTVIIRYIVGRRAPYVVKVTRGVRCFHLDRSLRLLATGGKDSVVRLWNPIMPKKPVGSLFGHKCSIVDVRILKHLNVVLSISKDTVTKVWDIVKQTCMQSLPLLFPVHGELARAPEFGVQSFYPGHVSCTQPSVLSSKSSTEIVLSARSMVDSNCALDDVKSAISSKKDNFGSVNTEISSKTETKTSTKNDPSVTTYSSTLPNTEISSKTETKTSTKNDPSVTTYSSTLPRLPTLGSRGESSFRHETRTGTRFTNVTERSGASSSCMESAWTRMELLVVSCNYVVVLQLSERELDESESKRVGEPRDPPLRDQDPVAPSPWLTVDDELLAGVTDVDARRPLGEGDAVSVSPTVLAMLRNNLGDDMTRELISLAATCQSHESQQTDLKQIRAMVDQCAPHLALRTTDLEEIPFSIPTAIHSTKERRKDKDVLRDKKLTRASTFMQEDSDSSRHVDTLTTTKTESSSTSKSNR